MTGLSGGLHIRDDGLVADAFTRKAVRIVGPPSAEELERDLLEARAALGVAVMIMTPEQMAQWGQRMREMRGEASP